MLNVSTKTIYRWVGDGRIPGYRVNKQYRFDRSELLEWARAQHLAVATEVELDPDHTEEPTPTLDRAIEAGGIHYRVEGSDPASVLRAAVGALLATDRDRLHDALLAREELASTAVGGGFALPHVRNPLRFELRAPAIGVCMLERPVDWKAPDGRPVSALLVVVGTTVRQVLRLHTHALFALRDPGFAGAILEQASRERISAEARRVAASLQPWPTP